MPRKQSITNIVDWKTIVIYIILVIMGWFSVYAASYSFETDAILDFSQRAGKQLIWIGFAGVIAVSILLINSRMYETFAYVFYGFMLVMLIATRFLAPDIKGSHSWLVLGPISIQPAELAKFVTALALAKYMSRYDFKLRGIKSYIPVCAIILLPMALIILQNETGSALVLVSLFLVLYRKGMPGVFLYLGLCAVVMFILVLKYVNVYVQPGNAGQLGLLLSYVFIFVSTVAFVWIYHRDVESAFMCVKVGLGVFAVAWIVNRFIVIDYVWFCYALLGFVVVYTTYRAFSQRMYKYLLIGLFVLLSIGFCFSAGYMFDNVLQPHQQSRINVLLGTEEDLSGSGYNVNQSMIAIGSGGFLGKGFLHGTQTKLNYVPEQDTDFIFCTIGEETGFLGSFVVMALYLALMIRVINIAERQTETFNQVYAYCVASLFFFHFTINIGMVIGLMPVIGIPLPFFSYGGSSLWGFTILLFVLLKLDSKRLER